MENICWLIDMRNIYQLCKTALQKQELIRTVFDISPDYENRVHRTPYLISELAHNELIMKEKALLIINKKGDFLTKIPSGGGEGIASAPLRRSQKGGASTTNSSAALRAPFLRPSA